MSAISLCASHFAEAHPDEAARVLEQQSAVEGERFLSGLQPREAAAVMNHMTPVAAAEILALSDRQTAVATATALPPGSVSIMLRRLDPERRAAILSALADDLRDLVDRLLEYPDGTVGAVADPDVLTVPIDATAEAAQQMLRHRDAAVHHQLFVVDRAHRLVGYIHVRDLVRAAAKTPINSVMRPATLRVQAGMRLASSIAHPAWRDLDAIPVVDRENVLLGILRHRQIRRLQSAESGGELKETIFGLSELYWMGLSTLMLPTEAGSPGTGPAPTARNGGDHGN